MALLMKVDVAKDWSVRGRVSGFCVVHRRYRAARLRFHCLRRVLFMFLL